MSINISFKPDNEALDRRETILDESWGKFTFRLSDADLGSSEDMLARIDRNARFKSSADNKFTTTSMGLNFACNSRPQRTRYADIRSKGRWKTRPDVTVNDRSMNYGMGRYYSEAYDDHAQRIYMRLGVPQYNYLATFLTQSFSVGQTLFVTKGRFDGVMQAVLLATATLASVFVWTRFFGVAVGMMGLRAMYNWLGGTSRFVSLKPTMFMYWMAVDEIVNTLMVKRNLAPWLIGGRDISKKMGDPQTLSDEEVKAYAALANSSMGNIFNAQGRVDVFALVNRATRINNKLSLKEYNDVTSSNATNYLDYLDGLDNTFLTASSADAKKPPTLVSHIANWINTAFYKDDRKYPKQAQANSDTTNSSVGNGSSVGSTSDVMPKYLGDNEAATALDPAFDPLDLKLKVDGGTPGHWESLKEAFGAELADGAAFAVFNVESTGSMSESFSNSAGENKMGNILNSIASGSRSLSYSLAGGNIAAGLSDFTEGVKAVLAQGASTATLNIVDPIISALYGNKIEIGKQWEDSSSPPPHPSYKMQLISPYGNAMAQLQNIYIPLAMILATVVPRSTGTQSYTSPFNCQVFDRGRCQIPFGIVDSVTVSRGTSNLSFNTRGQAMAIDVSFSILDLSNTMFMHVANPSFLEAFKSVDSDNSFDDYLTAIAGLDVFTQVYGLSKGRLRLAMDLMRRQKYASPAFQAALGHEVLTSGAIGATLGLPANAAKAILFLASAVNP